MDQGSHKKTRRQDADGRYLFGLKLSQANRNAGCCEACAGNKNSWRENAFGDVHNENLLRVTGCALAYWSRSLSVVCLFYPFKLQVTIENVWLTVIRSPLSDSSDLT
jgi:hypothetical protein